MHRRKQNSNSEQENFSFDLAQPALLTVLSGRSNSLFFYCGKKVNFLINDEIVPFLVTINHSHMTLFYRMQSKPSIYLINFLSASERVRLCICCQLVHAGGYNDFSSYRNRILTFPQRGMKCACVANNSNSFRISFNFWIRMNLILFSRLKVSYMYISLSKSIALHLSRTGNSINQQPSSSMA